MASKRSQYQDVRKTPGFRERLRRGAAIAKALGPPVMGASDCAELFGISTQALRQIECLALAKIDTRLREALSHE